MTVTGSTLDDEHGTLTIEAELPAPPDRVWQVWSDPRLLERWWGPPMWPATFGQHDLTPGGGSRYAMTGPEGERVRGWWRILAADEPGSLELEDGFADDHGEPDPGAPTIRVRVTLDGSPDGTRMRVTTSFASAEQMAELVQMGVVEGMTGAVGQIDAVLAAP